MKTPTVGRGLLALAFFAAWGVVTGANAGVFRAFLSSTGNDANPCSLTAPCRLLPAALAAVVNGGRITMLDSANYNPGTVTITKSVTIDANPGGSAGVAAINGDAIFINTAGVSVTLRNLVILNYGGGVNGIEFVQGNRLNVENCEISNMDNDGIAVFTGTATIANSIIRNNGNGVRAQDGAQVVVSASHVLGNGLGVFAYSQASTTTKATVSDTTLSGNSEALFAQANVAGSDAQIFATRSTITNNGYGVFSLTLIASASSLVTLSANMITNNSAAGIYASGASAKVKSLGNNHVADNATDGAPTSTIALK